MERGISVLADIATHDMSSAAVCKIRNLRRYSNISHQSTSQTNGLCGLCIYKYFALELLTDAVDLLVVNSYMNVQLQMATVISGCIQ